jgi:hypothetical protein
MLPQIEPSPDADLRKSAHAVLIRGAQLFREHGQPPSDVSEFETLADLLARSTHDHFLAYLAKCQANNQRAAALDAGRTEI